MIRDPAVYQGRLDDWRTRQIVYQVFVDRFSVGRNLAGRREHFAAPRRLRAWTDQPTRGKYVPEAGCWSQEIDFWGGDLAGLRARLDHINALGCNVVYLNPIFEAFTNHKYDTTDYLRIDPQLGSQADFEDLCAVAHDRGIRIVLDGVFNHTGRRSPWFVDGAASIESPFREHYRFDPAVRGGYVAWRNASNLPELAIENPVVREYLLSVVKGYMRVADGWRLDVAGDLGPAFLSEVNLAAREGRADAFTVGEFFNYPAEWFPSVDGAMNLYLGTVLLGLAKGDHSAAKASRLVADLVADCGIENLLRSWTVVSNHDKPRLLAELPDLRDRRFVWALMATLPGAPLIYYGEEVGLAGDGDPACRGPMDWAAAEKGTPEQEALRQLLAIRQGRIALQIGDYVPLAADRLLAFARRTASARDSVVVLANPARDQVEEAISPRDSWLLDSSPMVDLLSGAKIVMQCGFFHPKVPPRTVQIWVPEIHDGPGYQFLKRVP